MVWGGGGHHKPPQRISIVHVASNTQTSRSGQRSLHGPMHQERNQTCLTSLSLCHLVKKKFTTERFISQDLKREKVYKKCQPTQVLHDLKVVWIQNLYQHLNMIPKSCEPLTCHFPEPGRDTKSTLWRARRECAEDWGGFCRLVRTASYKNRSLKTPKTFKFQ